MNKLIVGCCCVLAVWTAPTAATSIYRCSDANGNLTFTQQGCPLEQTGEVTASANPTPGSGEAIPLAQPVTRKKTRQDRSSREITVVGAKDDGCGNLITGSAKRDALIKKQVHPGMSRADVESAFGTPDAITSRNGKVQYRYSSRKGRTRTVTFDQHGCVGGKS